MPRVLVVDDDWPIRALVSKIVERRGIEVDSACDGDEALRRIDENHYDVVVLDLMMPRVNGFQVLDEIRRRRKRHPVIIVISAQPDSGPALRLDPDLVQSVVRKPFDIDLLADLISTAAQQMADRDESDQTNPRILHFPVDRTRHA